MSGNIGKVLEKDTHSYHVMIGAKNSLVDGITISEGFCKIVRRNNRYGGGIQMIGFDQTMNVKNCIFENNEAYIVH